MDLRHLRASEFFSKVDSPPRLRDANPIHCHPEQERRTWGKGGAKPLATNGLKGLPPPRSFALAQDDRHALRRSAAVLLALVLSAGATLASAAAVQSVPPRAFPADAAAAAAEPPPLRIAETYDLAPLATLRAAEEAAAGQIAALRRWNDARRLPVKDGFARSLPAPRTVELTAELLDRPLSAHAGGMVAQPSFDRLAWGAEVRVEEAYRLRLRLANVHLPHASRLW